MTQLLMYAQKCHLLPVSLNFIFAKPSSPSILLPHLLMCYRFTPHSRTLSTLLFGDEELASWPGAVSSKHEGNFPTFGIRDGRWYKKENTQLGLLSLRVL
ncbi:hypothetical protein N7499_003763 [Penicillium canescens]|nr:hypothetical protein N7499_003763 [Penicillium canescens]